MHGRKKPDSLISILNPIPVLYPTVREIWLKVPMGTVRVHTSVGPVQLPMHPARPRVAHSAPGHHSLHGVEPPHCVYGAHRRASCRWRSTTTSVLCDRRCANDMRGTVDDHCQHILEGLGSFSFAATSVPHASCLRDRFSAACGRGDFGLVYAATQASWCRNEWYLLSE